MIEDNRRFLGGFLWKVACLHQVETDEVTSRHVTTDGRERDDLENAVLMDAAGTPIEELKIILADGEHGIVVCLDGRLNVDSSPAFRDQLLAILLEQSPKNLTVDLARVSYIDSSGIATLIQGLKIARQHRIGLHLTGLEGRLLHFFEATGVLGLFASEGIATSPASKVS